MEMEKKVARVAENAISICIIIIRVSNWRQQVDFHQEAKDMPQGRGLKAVRPSTENRCH